MSSARIITPVTDAAEKQRTYREQMGKYRLAMRHGFYLQALMSSLGIKNISGKIKLVRCVLLWTQEEDAARGDRFLIALKNQCEGNDIDAVLTALEGIAVWCDYRNEVVHGLMNKNLDSLEMEIKGPCKSFCSS